MSVCRSCTCCILMVSWRWGLFCVWSWSCVDVIWQGGYCCGKLEASIRILTRNPTWFLYMEISVQLSWKEAAESHHRLEAEWDNDRLHIITWEYLILKFLTECKCFSVKYYNNDALLNVEVDQSIWTTFKFNNYMVD